MLAHALAFALAASPPPAEPESRPPKPDQAHGIAKPHRGGAKKLLWIPRAILYLPRRTLDLALSPVRAALWAYERYKLEDRYQRAFYFERRTFGLFPTARFESSFGASVGVRMVHRDLFHRGGTFSMNGTFGGVYGRRFGLAASSPRLGKSPVRIGVSTEYRTVPADRFYGIGNGDVGPAPPFGTRIDPRVRDTAVSTRFEHEYAKLSGLVSVSMQVPLRMVISSTFTWRRFAPAQRTSLPDTEVVYTPDGLIGYQTGLTNVYNQLRLQLDTRRPGRTRAVAATGWFGAFYGGHAIGLGNDPSNFGRLGLDVQRFVDLWGGTRVLRLRGVVDSAIGPLDAIPFVELPMLGGPYYLRGYPRGRFRDRIAAFGTLEYIWEIEDHIAGFLFLEPGRVWSGTLPIEPGPMRMGLGGGFQIHTRRMFLARIQLASSIDGGFGMDLLFAPATRLRDGR